MSNNDEHSAPQASNDHTPAHEPPIGGTDRVNGHSVNGHAPAGAPGTPDPGSTAKRPRRARNGSGAIPVPPTPGKRPQGPEKGLAGGSATDQEGFLSALAAGCPEGLHFLVAKKRDYVDKTTGKPRTAFPAEGWREQPLTGPWYFSTGASERSDSRKGMHLKAFRAIVIDDVGTKVDPAQLKLAPTWVLVTSDGNAQWGYMLPGWSTDIHAGDELFAGLVKAGLQDPGVRTCCRLFRLPGSINDKPGRGSFASTLHSFDADVVYTLEQIATGLGVTPETLPRRERTATKVPPTSDPIFDWLSTTGRIVSPKDGTHYVIDCPWHDEHSFGEDAWCCPRTESDTGAFSVGCFHGHGVDKSDYRKRFLAWVKEQGGPAEHDMTAFGDLLREMREAGAEPLWPNEPEVEVELDEETTPDPAPVRLDDIPDRVPEHPFIVEDWLPDGVVTLFAAHGGRGKSFIALYLAICIAAGIQVLDSEVAQRRVVFYSCEDDANTLRYRVRMYCNRLGIEPAALQDWLLLLDATGSDNVLFSGDAKVGQRLMPRFKWLRSQVETFDAGLLVLDNASDAFDGNENERSKVRQFITHLKRLAPATLLLAHVDAVTAMQKNVGDGKGYSGSTGWHNSARCRWEGGGPRQGEMDLLLAKNNYGRTGLLAPFTFDKTTKVWTAGGVRSDITNPSDNLLQVLRLAHTVIEGGVGLAPSPNASNGPGSLLKLDGAPRGLKSRDVTAALLVAVQRGYLRVGPFTVDYKTKERYAFTESGLELLRMDPAEKPPRSAA